MNNIQYQEMLDADGQNLAVRSFLLMYSCDRVISISDMRNHMEMSGWGGMWPEVVSAARDKQDLTKACAQVWIRYLFSLEV
ncbi:hypothetical protein SAMN05216319_1349 [Duganella sp. CF402]|uniref:hypothetical protein n=1 Tax=unclassified Duganella TaxID=2636909 RepID=UPI0008C2306C|nr:MULTISPECIES: hypothetical protein [unclassified Duganella]RZT10198.1 hypothetical protein EV582_2276 [Duganella sp. BK701]SEL23768.1 hypothetical protein SAMN05216319_1349 [Duganella sp. CF402]